MIKKEILFVVDQLEAGGLERQLSYLVSALSKMPEYRVSCFVWNFSENAYYYDFFKEHISGDLTGSRAGESFSTRQKALNKWVKQNKPKRIVSYSNFTNFQAFLAGVFTKAKSFGSIRSSSDYMLENLGPKKLASLLFPRNMLCCSTVAIKEFKAIWWLKHIKYHYFANHINLSSFARKSPDQVEEYSSISVGTLLPEKRLIRAFELVASMKEIDPNVKHVHLGDGPLLEEYRQKSKDMGLEDNLIFHGKTQAVHDFLLKSKMLVHFSDFEGIPNVVLEAMAVGLPVITTDCGDVEQYVKDQHNGYVVKRAENYDPELFFSYYSKLLADKTLREKLGTLAYEEMTKSDIKHMPASFLSRINFN